MDKQQWSREITGQVFPYHTERMQKKILVELVTEGQTRYDALVGALGRHGTEASRRRVIDYDPNLAPHKFIKGASHEFVFPKQQIKARKVTKLPIGERGHRVTREVITAHYPSIDESLVQGRLRLSYDDSSMPPRLVLEDLLGNSDPVLSEEIMHAIEVAFKDPTT